MYGRFQVLFISVLRVQDAAVDRLEARRARPGRARETMTLMA
jgi:hypothetical protein